MVTVLVTGGTGTLGRHLVPLLRAQSHTVRVLSRQPGAGHVKGDLRTGEGLDRAVRNVDAVVHAATAPIRSHRVDIDGTRRLIEAARENGRPHFIYVSIVGADRIGVRYYKAKLEAERLVQAAELPWTIQRATQFHELLDAMLSVMKPVIVAPRGFRFQPLAAAEAAERVAALVQTGASGHVQDVGGPEICQMGDLARVWRQARELRRPLLRPPVPGRVAASFRKGANLAPDNRIGELTWLEWLRGS